MRLCVPLFDVSFTDDSTHRLIADERFELAPSIALVRLADHEAAEMRKWVVGGDARLPLLWRVEVEINDLFATTITDSQAVALVRRIVSLVSCAVRFAPRWNGVQVKVRHGDRWVWQRHIQTVGDGSARHSYVPRTRMETWGRLLRHWPILGSGAPVELALEFHTASIEQRQDRPEHAFVLAMAAIEALLGYEAGPDLDEALAARASTLLVVGETVGVDRLSDELVAAGRGTISAAIEWVPALSAEVREWQRARHRYVRRGVPPDPDVLVRMHRFLMRALPSMVRLIEAVGDGHAHAIGWLDASRENLPNLASAMTSRGTESWWNYVDLDSILD